MLEGWRRIKRRIRRTGFVVVVGRVRGCWRCASAEGRRRRKKGLLALLLPPLMTRTKKKRKTAARR